MTRKPHVAHNFNKMNCYDRVLLGKKVLAGLTANQSRFPHLPVSLADLAAANKTLEDAFKDYKMEGGTAFKGAYLNATRLWLQKFRLTARYVDTLANGSILFIGMSGFRLTKFETSPPPQPAAARKSNFLTGQVRGTALAKIAKVADTAGYIFSMATAGVKVEKIGNQLIFKVGDECISLIIGTERNVKFTGLPRHRDFKATIGSFNRAGLGTFTSEVSVGVV